MACTEGIAAVGAGRRDNGDGVAVSRNGDGFRFGRVAKCAAVCDFARLRAGRLCCHGTFVPCVTGNAVIDTI